LYKAKAAEDSERLKDVNDKHAMSILLGSDYVNDPVESVSHSEMVDVYLACSRAGTKHFTRVGEVWCGFDCFFDHKKWSLFILSATLLCTALCTAGSGYASGCGSCCGGGSGWNGA
jgi:hypothetical protein